MSETEPKTEGGDVEETEPPEGEAPSGETPIDPIAAAEAERDKTKDQLLRVAADFDNFRKRTRKDLELKERKGKEDVLKEVLPVIDNLERAVQATTGDASDLEAVRQGVEMVLRQFEDVSQRLGLKRLSSKGERFDPSCHDAIQQLETDDHPAGTVVEEILPGYQLGDRLLRAAMVVVARPKPTDDDE